jgi:hypothetical protein
MQLELIIQALRARVASLGPRVAGAAQFKLLQENAQLQVPCAYVIPLDDTPGEQFSENTYRQDITDSFAVIVAVANTADEKGQGGANAIHVMRAALWGALLGWCPTDEYEPIQYEGSQLLQLDRARMWFQFEFSAITQLDVNDTWQGYDLGQLPPFEGATLKVDALDPMRDPNVALDDPDGPDGRIESGATVPKTGDFPQ